MKEQDELGRDRLRSRHATRTRLTLFVTFLLVAVMLAAPTASPAQGYVGVSVEFGPPALPIYVQPPCPDRDFIWIPGYWAWYPDYGYYWVPGMWVLAPYVGVLWTPGYWAWNDGMYMWYEGYWGPEVGYYGGINYGYGYPGYGYYGGYWSGNRFYYNQSVNNVNIRNITTVYRKPVKNVRPSGASFNGPGGATVRPTSEQLAAARQQRASLIDAQQKHLRAARSDPRQRAAINRGRPAVAATTTPGVFSGRGVVGASRAGAPYKAVPGRKAAPERMAPGTSREVPERRVNGPHQAPQRSETTRPFQPREETRGRTEMRSPAAAPERMAPGTSREVPERRVNEPRQAPQRQEATRPSQREDTRKEDNRDEREERR